MSRATVAFAALLLLAALAAVPSAQAGPIQTIVCDPPETCNLGAPPCSSPVHYLCDAGSPFHFCFVYAHASVVTVCL